MRYAVTGNIIANYREQTESTHAKMAGVSFLTFKCRQCGHVKPVRGRKSRGYKLGFKCAECAA